MSSPRLTPVTLAEARRFVGRHHRHAEPPVGWKFGVGLADDAGLVAVAIAGRPASRVLDDGETIEVTRVCTLGDRNAASTLYGALTRAAKALGYRRAVTYTLATEPGSSPAAAGFRRVADLEARPGWSVPSRLRMDGTLFGDRPTVDVARVRWERDL